MSERLSAWEPGVPWPDWRSRRRIQRSWTRLFHCQALPAALRETTEGKRDRGKQGQRNDRKLKVNEITLSLLFCVSSFYMHITLLIKSCPKQ